jgi:hypothetical protein
MKALGLIVCGALGALLFNLAVGFGISAYSSSTFVPTCRAMGGMPVQFRDGTRICMAPGAGLASPQGGPTL